MSYASRASNRRHLMLPVTVARRAGEHRDDDLRPERAHHLHDVAEQRILRPVLEGLGGGLREAEVVRAREELMRPVDAPRGEQLFRANHAERLAELVADEVLSAVAAREREIRGLRADCPRASHAISCVSSSSGCAPITSTVATCLSSGFARSAAE